MLVIHGFWLAGPGLCLWAEDSELLVKSRSQAYRSARSHPFAASQAALDGIHAGKPGEMTMLLVPQMAVGYATRKELSVAPLIHDPATVKHDDVVRIHE